MLFSLLLAAVCIPGTDEFAQYASEQMFRIQQPYRYHIQLVEVRFERRRGGYHARTTDYYANRIRALKVEAPQDARFPKGSVSAGDIVLEDLITFPESRCARFDIASIRWEEPALLTITDRREEKAVWPPPPPDP